MTAPYKMRKGIAYFETLQQAATTAAGVGGRVVRYELGWAVQYYKSGPYWPEQE